MFQMRICIFHFRETCISLNGIVLGQHILIVVKLIYRLYNPLAKPLPLNSNVDIEELFY